MISYDLPGEPGVDAFTAAKPELGEPPEADADEQRRRERRWLAEHTGVPEERIVFLKQVHGETSVRVFDNAEELHKAFHQAHFAEADALFTNDAGILLVVRTADCLPLFFALRAPDEGAGTFVGVIHAGWRGMHAHIIGKTLGRVLRMFPNGTRISGSVWVGPCISRDFYEVGEDVARHFTQVRPGGLDPQRSPEKFRLDLAAEARLQVEEALRKFRMHRQDFLRAGGREHLKDDGVAVEWLEPLSDGCTYEANSSFFSHRRGDRGRNLNAIRIV